MRPSDKKRGKLLAEKLQEYARGVRPLPGVEEAQSRSVLVEQMVESLRRIEFVAAMLTRKTSPARADPSTELFDPLRAAALHAREGNIDEACWLVFLFVHFGKDSRNGYRLARTVYGRLGRGSPWTWTAVSKAPGRFRSWLEQNAAVVREEGGKFGNHRAYESLKASPLGTGAVIESYVRWVGPRKSHPALFVDALQKGGGKPDRAFDLLYRSMAAVARFGRLARFDYLTMVLKLGLAPISPGIAYLQGAGAGQATGPLRGARLLFGGSVGAELTAKLLDAYLVDLGAYLGLGMQVLEDSLCNWQKSPSRFRAFRG